MNVEITDNSGLVREEFQAVTLQILEEWGLVGEGFAKLLCPVDTGNLRNSITHVVAVSENVVYIGTNSEYGVYVELGTGKYYPGGRPTPWAYQDARGDWHLTNGQRAQPYIKPAVADHISTYRDIAEKKYRG